MKKSRYKRFAFCLSTFAFLISGCQYAGIVSLLGTPGHYERQVPAEYDLAEHTDQKILVLVDQPAYLGADVNLRYYLTGAINKNLVEKVGIDAERLVSYSELSEFRSTSQGFSLLSPVQIAEALNANVVLLVVIEDYQLSQLAEADYYKANLSARAVLLEAATGNKLWPQSAESKTVKVGFDIEDRGREVATARLVTASAYCLVRYFYDCPKNRFNIADDRSGIGWENWDMMGD